MIPRSRFSVRTALLALLAGGALLSGQTRTQAPVSPSLLQQRWNADWIACPNAPVRDAGVFHFRKSIHLDAVPAHFIVHVSADNHFLLMVNGHRIGEGPAYSDPGHWKFESYDLAQWLQPGDNVLAATVWNFGTSAAVRQMTNRSGFILQGDSAAEAMANTDSSWQVEPDPGLGVVSPKGARHLGYFAAGPGEELDGRHFDWNWATSQGSGWESVDVLSHGAPRGIQDSPNAWGLIPDPLPPMEWTPISPGTVVRSSGVAAAASFPNAAVTIPAHQHATLLLRTPAEMTAYPELTVSQGAGAVIRLTYSEALYDQHGQKGNRNDIEGRTIRGVYDEFLPDGGAQRTFLPLDWRTWRYLQLDVQTADQPVTLDKLQSYFTAYPFQEKATFSSDAAWLKPVWQTSWRTARLCAHTTYMDCPYWERLQYVGDTRIQALISYVMTGDDRLARQAINAIDESRIPDGITTSRYPSELPQYIPTFSLMWVGMVHDFWQYRNDPAFVKSHLEGTRTVLDWFLSHENSNGLMGKLPWWNFVDWTSGYRGGVPPQDAHGDSTAITLQFVEALKNAADLESAFGSPTRAALYRRHARQSLQAVYRLGWDAQHHMIADTPEHTSFSQEANFLAVWLDAVPATQQKALLRRIMADELGGAEPGVNLSKSSYYFRFYLARALEHAGLGQDYLQLLGPWRNMLKLGLTTWAEQPEPTRSDCHAWSAHPNYDLLTTVAGIQPAAPDFARVRIAPNPGELHHVEASMPSPHGLIVTRFDKTASGWQANITLPQGLPGTLVWQGHSYPLHAGAQQVRLP